MLENKALSYNIQDEKTSFLNSFFIGCKQQFGEENFNKWLSKLEVASYSENDIIFSAPSKFIRDWVIREFLEIKGINLLSIAKNCQNKIKKISIIYTANQEEKALQEASFKVNSSENKIVNLSKYDNIFAFGTELNPRYTFKNFISAKYNKLALSMAKIAAKVEGQISLFEEAIPLFIHGGVGMGKTHLAQAIAWEIQAKDKTKKVVYLSAEKFMYHFVQSVRNNDVMDFKEKMRSIDVLIVDDVQFIAGKESTQQEFMNSFNHLVTANKQVVLVCDRCPSNLENIDEKLRSRITGGMIVNFKNVDYQDRFNILKAKADLLGQEIDEKIISLLSEKITSSVRDLEGALKKLIAAKVLAGEEIDLENAKNITLSYSKVNDSLAITVQKIQKIVSEFYDIKITDLKSSNRTKPIAQSRQIAMYLCKNLTTLNLAKIGQDFGNKNHATVIHAIKTVEKMMKSNDKIFQEIKSLEEKIRQ